MKKYFSILFVLLIAAPMKAQWTNKGGYPATVSQRGWGKPIYDPVDKKMLLYWAYPNCCTGTFSNNLQLYDTTNNLWSNPSLWTHNTTGSGLNQGIASITRTSNIVTVALNVGAALQVQVNDPVLIQSVTDASFNGTFKLTAVTDQRHFSWAQTGSDATSSGGVASGPGDSENGPSDKHPYGVMGWDTTRNTFYTGFGSADLGGNASFQDGANYSFTIFNPVGGAWTVVCGVFHTLCTTPQFTQEAGSAYLSGPDKIYIYSGNQFGTPVQAMWSYAPTTNTWTTVCTSACTPGAIDGPAMFAISSSKFMIYGGIRGTGASINQAYIYDSSNNTWTTAGSTGPSVGRFPVIDYVPRLGAAILIDQQTPAHTWKFDLTTYVWTDLNISGGPTLPADVSNNAGGYDPNADRFDVFLVSNVWQLQLPASGPTISVPLTVQEAIVTGQTGVVRTNEPVTVGIPIPDSAGFTSASQFGLSGASVGQFRVTANWPDGNVKWVLIDTVASLTAGGTNTSITLTGGTGNFGGSNLGTDNGTTITVATGAATFTIQKANFDVIHQATIGASNFVGSEVPMGLVLPGPAFNNTTCGASIPCASVYASSYDSSSTCILEENGPVRATTKCTGALKDASGNLYMRYTCRMSFYLNKTYVRIRPSLQNADYDGTVNPGSPSFTNSYKGFGALEIRLPISLGTGKTYAFGNHTVTPTTGSFSSNENAYIYQAYSTKEEDSDWTCPDYRNDPRPYIARTLVGTLCQGTSIWNYAQEGYKIVDGSTTLLTGSRSQYPTGWADLADSTGAGVAIGAYRMAGYWPKSLQLMGGGTEIRIGIYPDQTLGGTGGQQYFQSWPQQDTGQVWMEFHSSALLSAADDFTRYEAPLIARAGIAAYNTAGVFNYPLLDPTVTDNFYLNLKGADGVPMFCATPVTGPCLVDIANPAIYRTYFWRGPGGSNQMDLRWAGLMLWLTRGHVGRYIQAKHFYHFVIDQSFPRSDIWNGSSFHWRDATIPVTAIGSLGLPNNVRSANTGVNCDNFAGQQPTPAQWFTSNSPSCGNIDWIDSQHGHAYGLADYYYMTGDMFAFDAIPFGITDMYGNPNTNYAKNGFYFNTRDIGIAIMWAGKLHNFYAGTGDSTDAAAAFTTGDEILVNQIYPNYLTSGYGSAAKGVNRNRGNQYAGSDPTQSKPFMYGILNESLWEYTQERGSSWTNASLGNTPYQTILDLGSGVANHVAQELWVDTGNPNKSTTQCTDGQAFAYEIDWTTTNNPLTPDCDATTWFNSYILSRYGDGTFNWQNEFKQNLYHLNQNSSSAWPEYGTIYIDAVINELNNPSARLVDVASSVNPLGSGSYQVTFKTPLNAISYRIKANTIGIVNWIGFNPVTNAFTGDAVNNDPWFAATEMTGLPAVTPGQQQTATVSFGSGTTANFKVRAIVVGQSPIIFTTSGVSMKGVSIP